MDLEEASVIAETWVSRLAPACQRIEIAGSIRRQKPQVKDIELVCISKGGIFDPLERAITEAVNEKLCSIIKGGSKYKQLSLAEGLNLDLFIVQPHTWAVQFVIRTGPAEFSHWIVTKRKYGGALPSNCNVKHGQVWKLGSGKPLEFYSEQDFLEFLKIGWVPPEKRRANLPFVLTPIPDTDHYEAPW